MRTATSRISSSTRSTSASSRPTGSRARASPARRRSTCPPRAACRRAPSPRRAPRRGGCGAGRIRARRCSSTSGPICSPRPATCSRSARCGRWWIPSSGAATIRSSSIRASRSSSGWPTTSASWSSSAPTRGAASSSRPDGWPAIRRSWWSGWRPCAAPRSARRSIATIPRCSSRSPRPTGPCSCRGCAPRRCSSSTSSAAPPANRRPPSPPRAAPSRPPRPGSPNGSARPRRSAPPSPSAAAPAPTATTSPTISWLSVSGGLIPRSARVSFLPPPMS